MDSPDLLRQDVAGVEEIFDALGIPKRSADGDVLYRPTGRAKLLRAEVERLRTLEAGLEGYSLVSLSAPIRTNGHGEQVWAEGVDMPSWVTPTDGVPLLILVAMFAKPDPK